MSSKEESRVKKLVLILTTSMPVTAIRKKTVKNTENDKNSRTTAGASKDNENPRTNLAQVPCIQYPIVFQKKFNLALLNSSSEVNAIFTNFAKKLGLSIRPIDIKAQKSNGAIPNTYKMVFVAFLISDKAN